MRILTLFEKFVTVLGSRSEPCYERPLPAPKNTIQATAVNTSDCVKTRFATSRTDLLHRADPILPAINGHLGKRLAYLLFAARVSIVRHSSKGDRGLSKEGTISEKRSSLARSIFNGSPFLLIGFALFFVPALLDEFLLQLEPGAGQSILFCWARRASHHKRSFGLLL
ncbi:MAG: hypothetical protein RIC89_03340 [Pseudomonadales bacterium]